MHLKGRRGQKSSGHQTRAPLANERTAIDASGALKSCQPEGKKTKAGMSAGSRATTAQVRNRRPRLQGRRILNERGNQVKHTVDLGEKKKKTQLTS